MFSLNTTGSDCARKASVNPFAGTATVTFRNGYGPYSYTGVSRRSILKVLALNALSDRLSVGRWINASLPL